MLILSLFNSRFNSSVKNHPSALMEHDAVDGCFREEVDFNITVGPLDCPPFQTLHYSLLLTGAKSDGSTRVIVDLLWPIRAIVNDNVPDNVFDISHLF